MAIDLLSSIPWLVPVSSLILTFIAILGVFRLVRRPLTRGICFLAENLRLWGRPLIDQELINRILVIFPVFAFMFVSRLVPDTPAILATIVERVTQATILVLILRVASAFLDNIEKAYSTLEISRNRPIKGVIQVFLIVLYLLTFIVVVSILVDKSPWIFISGLGAMTAVLLLVFRDTLLSLVAGLQLTSNNYIRVGDWIEMPQFGADGDVIDIALHAVRVQNWDKTITTIPTHKFLEHSFKNWRGMVESNGRRIKRCLYIDMSSIKFLSEAEIARFSNFLLLKDYMARKVAELREYNAQYAHDPKLIVNARRLTNIGTFRAYLANYLKQHPRVRQDMTMLVRHLAPTPEGLPIEIYVFANDTRWLAYEEIQADIFDHVIAIASEFDLRIFQSPTGADFKTTLGAPPRRELVN